MINMEAGSQCRCNISVERKSLKKKKKQIFNADATNFEKIHTEGEAMHIKMKLKRHIP